MMKRIAIKDKNIQPVNTQSGMTSRSGAPFAAPLPVRDAKKPFIYFGFLASFLSLAGFAFSFFRAMQPQPQTFFFSAIFITSFLIKCISNHLNTCVKKIGRYCNACTSFNRCRTLASSFFSSSSYFLRDFTVEWSGDASLYFPVPWHPQVHTSFNT